MLIRQPNTVDLVKKVCQGQLLGHVIKAISDNINIWYLVFYFELIADMAEFSISAYFLRYDSIIL